jgi:hypothetical protein
MGVMIIGIATFSLLVWVLTSSLAAECQAEKQRLAQVGGSGGDSVLTAGSDAPNQAA